MIVPSTEVLDLFAVPGPATPLPGGHGRSVVAGDLVLSPGRDPAREEWLSPLVARLAVTMDSRPGRRPLDLRLAVPVPARDGSWVVEGWAASRYEPDTVATQDLDVTLAAGRVLHAELASWVTTRPHALEGCDPAYDLPCQLVHTELFGHVLIDGHGAPVVFGVAPAWRPARWAEVLCVVDAVAAGVVAESALVRSDAALVADAQQYRRLNPR